MGRGKRISEWPGNIHFRQVINKYRDEYHQCSRKEKVKVANSVLEDITAIGGRFLHQIKGDKWEEVDYERAIEKACQALREKEKSRPPETSPFGHAGGAAAAAATAKMKPPKAPPSARPGTAQRRPAKAVLAMKKRKGKLKASNKTKNNQSNNSSTSNHPHRSREDQSTSTEESTSADESGNEEQSGEEESDSEVEEEESSGDVLPSPRHLSDERMIPLLEEFAEKHGHCAVAPWDCLNSSSSAPPRRAKAAKHDQHDKADAGVDKNDDEQVLANWCTVQRQIYREIESGYRDGSAAEKDRIKKLTKLGFTWDYEAWHWEQSFKLLQDELNRGAETRQGLSDEALLWIRQQRELGKRGMPLDPDQRAKRLKSIDVFII